MKYLFFVYCNEGVFELFETLDAALIEADERVQDYLVDCWSEEVTSVCVGEITHRAKMCDQVFPDGEIDADGLDEAGDYWDPDLEYKCNYKMLPVKKQSPAHDDAAPDVEQEPLAWIVNHPCFCGKFTDDKKIAEYWENEEQGCTAPLFLHPQPAPDVAKLVEALGEMIEVAKAFDSWESFPSDPIEKAEDAIRAYRQQDGDL